MGDELRKILCLLEPGMQLTVPDAWLERIIPGPLATRMRTVETIARQYGCHSEDGISVQTFQKLDVPATG